MLNALKHRLLQRQLKKYLPLELHQDNRLQKFLEVIDETYFEFDRDFTHLEGVLEKSLQELYSANESLLQRAEESERQTETIRDELQNVVDNINEVVFRTDIEGRWVYLNKAWAKITGFDVQSSIGKSALDWLNQENKEKLFNLFSDVVRGNKLAYETTFHYQNITGETRCIQVRARAIKDYKGWIQGLAGTLTDITEQYEAEENARKLAIVAQKTGNAVLLLNSNQEIVWVNKGFEVQSDYLAEEVIGLPYKFFLQGPETSIEALNEVLNALNAKQSYNSTILKYKRAYNSYWVKLAIDPIFYENGDLEGFVILQSDVSSEVNQQQRLERSEAWLKAILNSIPDYLWSIDNNFRVTFANDRTLKDLNKIYGVNIQSGQDIREAFPEDELPAWESFLSVALEGKPVRERIYRWLNKEKRFFDVSFSPVVENSLHTGTVIFIRDISTEVMAKFELEEKSDQLIKAQELGKMGSWIYNGKGLFLCSAQMRLMFGFDNELIIYQDFLNKLDPNNELQLAVKLETVDHLFDERIEHSFIQENGKKIELLSTFRKVEDVESRRGHIRGISLDITEQKEIRTRLESINEELDRFAYVVSHDLKAPVRAMYNLANFVIEDLAEGRVHSIDNINKIVERAKFMEMLINGILSFSRAGRLRYELKEIDTLKLVKELVDALYCPIEKNISFYGTWPVIISEEIPLIQVITNLIGNSVKYCDKEILVLELKCYSAAKFGYFAIEICDNGPGISPEFHGRIFELFQTLDNQDQQRGTGIGLALIKKIVSEKGGEVHLKSDVGRGSCFSFTWPLIEKGKDDVKH